MSAPAAKPKRRLPWWARVLMWATAFGALGACGIYVLGVSAAARWQRYAARLRAAGEPLTFEEIEALRTKIPDELNGARLIERLAPELDELPAPWRPIAAPVLGFGRKLRDVDFFTGIPRFAVEPSRDFLDEHRGLIEELTALRNMPRGRFRIAYQQNPLETMLPHIGALRAATRLTYLHATMQLIDRNMMDLTAIIQLQFHLGATLDEEPTLVSRIQQSKCDHLGVQSLENALRVGELDEQALALLFKEVATRLAASTMKWALLGERASFATVCEEVASSRLPLSWFKIISNLDGSPRSRLPPWLPEFVVRQNQIRMTEMHTWLVDASDDFSSMVSAAKKIGAQLPKLSRSYRLLQTLMPNYTSSVVQHTRSVAHLRCASVGIAAERFRLKADRLPYLLGELVPEFLEAVPIDPLTDLPMRLAVTEKGIVIYSIGEHLFDSSGVPVWRDGQPAQLDVGFQLYRPEHRGLLLSDEPPPAED